MTSMNNTLSTMEDLIRLDEIAESVFHVTPKIARRKAALNTLPVPAFRISGSRKGPLYVRKSDLERFIEERYQAAKRAQNNDVGTAV